MRLLDRILTRRRLRPHFSSLSQHVHRRLTLACQELTEAEQTIQKQLGLSEPPRLVMVDEETAAILLPIDRAENLSAQEPGHAPGSPPTRGR